MTAPAVLALLLAAPEPYAQGDAPWLCQQVHEHPTGSLWIARSADDRGRTASESLYWNVIESGRTGFQAYWSFPDRSARRPILAALRGEIFLSGVPERPVQVRLVVDGKVRPSAPAATEFRTYSGRSVLSFHYKGSNAFPDIHGRKSLTFVAVEEGGGEIGSLAIGLPDWRLVDRQVDRARNGLARDGRGRAMSCERRDDAIYD